LKDNGDVVAAVSYALSVHELDGYIVWNAHNTVLGEEALLIYISFRYAT